MGNAVWCPHLPAPLLQWTHPLISAASALFIFISFVLHQPDVVHITMEPYLSAFRFLPRNILRKTVLTIHGSYGVRILEDAARTNGIVKTLYKISAIITVSNYTKDRFLTAVHKVCGAETASTIAGKIFVIPNGIILPANPVPHEHQTKNILCIGGVKPRKNIVASLEAIALYRKQHDVAVHFTIVGETKDARYLAEVCNAIHRLELGTCTTIRGKIRQTELERLFAETDLYLMPAKTTHDTFEGFGLVYIEANAWGIPVIGPNRGGAIEAIKEGESGYTVDPADPQEIANRLHWILDERKISPSQCYAWAKRHSAERMVKETINTYDAALKCSA
jgi:glycosyltransferase involved in cell wall biosynthesis